MFCPHCGGQLAPAKPACDYCQEVWLPDQDVQPTPPIYRTSYGNKSGQLILVPTDNRWDFIHLWCSKAYFDPEYNGGIEQLREMIQEEVVQEQLESLKDQAREEVAEEMQEGVLVCGDCFDEIDIANMTQEERLDLYNKAYQTIMQLQPYFPRQS